jgi:hypothetical protein
MRNLQKNLSIKARNTWAFGPVLMILTDVSGVKGAKNNKAMERSPL